MKGLILDDFRELSDVYIKTGKNVYLQIQDWDVVKSFDEFTTYIMNNGVPGAISFDHDLTMAHYKEGASHNYRDFNYKNFTDTGAHAARWLVDNYDVSKCILLVHTANPFGEKTLNRILNL